MANYEKKISKALVEIAKTVEKLDGTLEKLDSAEGKIPQYFEQEKAIHEIKKITHEFDKIDKYEEKEAEEWARKITVDIEGQEKALENITKEVEKLDEVLSNMNDDDGKVKAFIAQKKATHYIKKILHNCGLYEQYVENEIEDL